MKRILLVDIQSFLWSYISIRVHLHKYETIIFIYSKEQFRTIKSLSKLIKKIAKTNMIANVQFIRIEGNAKNQSIYQKMYNITNEISDTYNPNFDIFHILCKQFPHKPILSTLESNGFNYSIIKANPIFINFDNEAEAHEFLMNSHEYNARFISVKEENTTCYDPNDIIRKETVADDDLIDIELFSLSVIDFMRFDLKHFSKIDEKELPEIKATINEL